MSHILSLITFIPLLGMLVILCLPRHQKDWIRFVSVFSTALPLALSISLFLDFENGSKGMQFVENCDWIRIPDYKLRIQYKLGVDGVSMPLVLLTGILSFLAVFASWETTKGVKAYFALLLLLETGMMGVFCSLDFFLFYVFWEVMLLPMYFLIGIWGGPRKEYAAIKFFLYTLFGSVLLLLAMLAFYFHAKENPNVLDPMDAFDLVRLADANVRLTFTGLFWQVVFVAMFIGFAIKVPVFPFHTWLPDAHVEAPTAISVILAGVLLKMGVYGLLRLSLPILPEAAAWFAPFMAALGLINIVYGALVAMAQTDLKKMVAYSSVSHMGFCLVGMAANTEAAMMGAAFQMFTHGLTSAMLFLLVGVIYDRAHHRVIKDFGGLAFQMPVYTGITTLAFMASLGLPGLCNFVSEALVLLGSFDAYRTTTIISATGIIFGAGYFLWCFQRVFMGPAKERYSMMPDVNGRELFTLVPLGALVVFLGVWPRAMLDTMTVSLKNVQDAVASATRGG
ncbi:MAG: NADH-quinone oxidoreductase subunit M [Planctomycetes bacterium]|nr:NADH-quinone oxidoreductase subunit M [Planctomycetota bacterium]